jgi:hypothetical protein
MSTEELFFDVNAKLEEQKKSVDQATLGFNLLITTKPNVVKYSTAGTVTLEGRAEEINKKLELNPKAKIPQILFAVYQHVFNSIYILSSILNAPYPPPDLLHAMAEKIQIMQANSQKQAQPEKAEASEEAKGQPSQPEKPVAAQSAAASSEKPATTQH